jgi:hypothetical protein
VLAAPADVIVVGDSSLAPLITRAAAMISLVLTVGGDVAAAGIACSLNRTVAT